MYALNEGQKISTRLLLIEGPENLRRINLKGCAADRASASRLEKAGRSVTSRARVSAMHGRFLWRSWQMLCDAGSCRRLHRRAYAPMRLASKWDGLPSEAIVDRGDRFPEFSMLVVKPLA